MAKRKKKDIFQEGLQNPKGFVDESLSNDEIVKEIEADNEKDYLSKLKTKHKGFLVDRLTLMERERIAQHIIDCYQREKGKHDELCGRIDKYDSVFRMERQTIPGDDGTLPNYCTGLTTVTLEVVHANIMNVFFTPKEIMRVLPTEEGDVAKVKKLTIFGNWSMTNEMELFERVDRLFHNSSKIGETPYVVHWVKEYGTEIVREVLTNPANPSEPLVDPDTKEPLFQEIDKPKLLYNGPRLEVFSRKDYIPASDCMIDELPEYEIRIIRYSFDQYFREELQGKMYDDTSKEIDWTGTQLPEEEKPDYQGDEIQHGSYKKDFIQFYGRLRIKLLKEDKEKDYDEYDELEDEFIAIVHKQSRQLCQLRKNKFPLKMRPIGVDYFMPDDEGRRMGIGIVEYMDGPQKADNVLFNQYLYGTTLSNNPFGFFTPFGNMRDESIKIKPGYLFPTSDSQSVNVVKIPAPDASMQVIMDIVRNWAQSLFGISDYAQGLESQIDPSAPAKKAEIVVAQGSVRLNMIIKRKNKTFRDIFKRWFLLYKENMPPNKFMRIAGEGENPFEFKAIFLSDFDLKSLPDFELTGNILNVNKSLEASKAFAIYDKLLGNPFFSPQTQQGLMALHSLTKWLLDKIDETGVSRFLPSPPGENVSTPEEENARFLQGDYGEPTEGEDHIYHLKVHLQMVNDPNVPAQIKNEFVIPHIQATIKMIQQLMTLQTVLSQGGNVGQGFGQGVAQSATQGAFSRPQGSLESFEEGNSGLSV